MARPVPRTASPMTKALTSLYIERRLRAGLPAGLAGLAGGIAGVWGFAGVRAGREAIIGLLKMAAGHLALRLPVRQLLHAARTVAA